MKKYLLKGFKYKSTSTNYTYSLAGNKNVEPMAIVANFLVDDVGDGKFFDWWLEDPQPVTGGNITWLSKTNSNSIKLEDLFIDDESYFIEMSKEQFINMIDNWKRIRQLNPPFILVSQDNQDNIHFQPLEESVDIENG